MKGIFQFFTDVDFFSLSSHQLEMKFVSGLLALDILGIGIASQCSYFDSYMGATFNIADLTK